MRFGCVIRVPVGALLSRVCPVCVPAPRICRIALKKVGGTGTNRWMVVRFVCVIRVPVCALLSRVCPVCVPPPPGVLNRYQPNVSDQVKVITL